MNIKHIFGIQKHMYKIIISYQEHTINNCNYDTLCSCAENVLFKIKDKWKGKTKI